MKPIEEFSDSKSKGSRGNRYNKATYCKPCMSQYMVDLRKKTRNEQRIRIIDAYGNKCAVCGFNDYRALVIDHVNDNGNEERKGPLKHPNNFYRHIIESKFPSDYQVLCANCNTIKEFERKFS